MGVAAHLLYNLPRTVPAGFSRRQFLMDSLVWPCANTTLLIAGSTLCLALHPSPLWTVSLLVVGSLPTAAACRRLWSEMGVSGGRTTKRSRSTVRLRTASDRRERPATDLFFPIC